MGSQSSLAWMSPEIAAAWASSRINLIPASSRSNLGWMSPNSAITAATVPCIDARATSAYRAPTKLNLL
jgi:hypothetical protein